VQLVEGNIIAEHYKLLRQLGRGSFGEVWLAHNLLADIDVAIKFYGAFDMQGLEDFRSEFKLAYQLHHPNLLNISHFDVCDSCPYLVMPYCSRGSVSQRVGKMTETEIWNFVRDISCGLAFLHSQKPPIIHQDIKPDNILIASDGRYIISDFGISRNLRTKMSRTSNQSSSGTIAYMGPERFSENPVIVLASDIWALGMTLYELMNGDVLWEGMGGCVQLNGGRMPVMDKRFSKELSQLVTACLQAETWDRPTAEQINAYADAYIKGLPLPPLTLHGRSTNVAQPSPAPVPNRPQPVSSTPYSPSGGQNPNHPQPVSPTSYGPSGGQNPNRPRPVSPTSYSSSRSQKPSSTSYSPSTKSESSSFSSFLPEGWTAKRVLLIVAALFAFVAIIIGVTSFIGSVKEEQQFVSCKTLQDYQQFISDYPHSSYVETARKRIADLSPAPQEEAQQATTQSQQSESSATEEAQNDDVERIVAYPTTSAPRNPVRTTSAPQRSSGYDADDAAFFQCVTSRDFHDYLNRFPNGKHRQQAERALTNLVNSQGGNVVIPTNRVDNRPIQGGSRRRFHRRPLRRY